jgi:hypothetical protein
MSDGPVQAELTIDGAKQAVTGAWVVVGPPDFVPPIHSYRTMYDSLVDVIVREMDIPADDGLFAGPLAHVAAMNNDWKRNKTIKDFSPSFTRDIAPILSAIARLERVHQQVWEKPFRLARNLTVGTIPVPGEGRRDVIVEAGAFSQQMALPWQADFFDCSAGPVDDPSVGADSVESDGGQ